jgi:hypothetical protein
MYPKTGRPRSIFTPGCRGDHHHRLLPVNGGFWIGFAHDDHDLAVLVQGVRRPPLAPVDDVLVTIALHAGLDVGRVGARDGGLGHRERGGHLAREKRPQVLSLCSSVPKRVSTSMLPVSGALQLMASGAISRLRPVISARCAYSRLVRPGLRMRVEQIPQTLATSLGLEVFEHLRLVVRIARCTHLLVVDALRGIDVLFHEGEETVAVVLSALAEFKHRGGPFLMVCRLLADDGWGGQVQKFVNDADRLLGGSVEDAGDSQTGSTDEVVLEVVDEQALIRCDTEPRTRDAVDLA